MVDIVAVGSCVMIRVQYVSLACESRIEYAGSKLFELVVVFSKAAGLVNLCWREPLAAKGLGPNVRTRPRAQESFSWFGGKRGRCQKPNPIRVWTCLKVSAAKRFQK